MGPPLLTIAPLPLTPVPETTMGLLQAYPWASSVEPLAIVRLLAPTPVAELLPSCKVLLFVAKIGPVKVLAPFNWSVPPAPAWTNAPEPEMVLFTVGASVRLKTNTPLLATVPAGTLPLLSLLP